MIKKNILISPYNFTPAFLLKNPKLQTILGTRLFIPRTIPAQMNMVSLCDGDQLVYLENRPINACDTTPVLVLCHGLLGSDHASYVVRTTQHALQQGYTVIRLNFRRCGPISYLAKGLCHSGRSEDIIAVLQHLTQRYPHAHLKLIGFSQGGNITLKAAGELQNTLPQLSQVIAVCPPINIAQSAHRINLPSNRLFQQHFIKTLKTFVQRRHRQFPELGPVPNIKDHHSFWQFDDYYTAPHSGFKNVHDYYQQASSQPYLGNIHCQTEILFSEDDPIVDSSCLETMTLPNNIHITKTRYGGHMGYFQIKHMLTISKWLDLFIMGKLQLNSA